MHYSRSSFVVVVVVVVLVVLLYIVAIAVSSRQCASGSPGASSPSGPPLPPPLCLRYSRFEPNTFDPSGPVTLIAFVFSPSVASTSYSTFSLCIVVFVWGAPKCVSASYLKKRKMPPQQTIKRLFLGVSSRPFPSVREENNNCWWTKNETRNEEKEKVLLLFSTWTLEEGKRVEKKTPALFSGKKPKSVSRTSRKLRNPSAFKCDWWTKISSLPSSGMINPNPLLALNHLTVFYFILESRERDRDGREKEDDVNDRSDF